MKIYVIVEYKGYDPELVEEIVALSKKLHGIDVGYGYCFKEDVGEIEFEFTSNRMAFTFRDKVRSERVKATLR
jgi:hypothetical protein